MRLIDPPGRNSDGKLHVAIKVMKAPYDDPDTLSAYWTIGTQVLGPSLLTNGLSFGRLQTIDGTCPPGGDMDKTVE